jgi:quercetin dioxygenase-like cupin family protein
MRSAEHLACWRVRVVVVTLTTAPLHRQPGGHECADLEEVPGVEIARLQDVQHAGPEGFVARPLLEGNQSNVRVIRLASGQALPPHRHGGSDLMLYVSDGQGELETATGKVASTAGCLAWYRGDEELRVVNTGDEEMTMLAFLAPKFATT